MTLCARPYSHREWLADRLLHGAALTAAIAGAALLLALTLPLGDWGLTGSVGLYGATLVLLFLCSALNNHYNLGKYHSAGGHWLQRLDHAAILLLIAGTYTPFAARVLAPPAGPALLALVWAVALGGAAAKLLLRRPPGRRVSVALYLALGWSVLAVLEPLAAELSAAGLALLLAGGLLYSAGVVLYLAYRLPYHHLAWHALVVAAAACHYAAVLHAVVLPARAA